MTSWKNHLLYLGSRTDNFVLHDSVLCNLAGYEMPLSLVMLFSYTAVLQW